jgi:hypothetical protein
VTIDRPEIDCAAGPAARTEDVEPRRSGDQRGADGGRPQHVAAGGLASVPTINDELRLEARSAIRLEPGGASLDVGPSCPDAHLASIGAPAAEVDSDDPSNFRRRRLLSGERARSNGRSMHDFPSPVFSWVACLLALLILALGPALDGATLKEAASVPALMIVWAGVVVLIDRWVVGPR